MKSPGPKRSIVFDGRKTSVSLDNAFWTDLKQIADLKGVKVSTLVAGIDAKRTQSNLSSAIRIFVLEHFRDRGRSAERATSSELDHSHVVALGPKLTRKR